MADNNVSGQVYDAAIEMMRPQLMRAAQAIGLSEDDARDIVQEGVAYCYTKLDEYNPAESSLGTWVTNIVVMLACRFVRDEKARRPGTEPEGFDPLVEDTGEYRRAQAKEHGPAEPMDDPPRYNDKLDVELALGTLDSRSRRVVWECIVEGYTTKECAERLGVSRQRVDQILASGLELMKQHLGPEYQRYRVRKLLEAV